MLCLKKSFPIEEKTEADCIVVITSLYKNYQETHRVDVARIGTGGEISQRVKETTEFVFLFTADIWLTEEAFLSGEDPVTSVPSNDGAYTHRVSTRGSGDPLKEAYSHLLKTVCPDAVEHEILIPSQKVYP